MTTLLPCATYAEALVTIVTLQDNRAELSDGRRVTLSGIAALQPLTLPAKWRNRPISTDCSASTDRYGQTSCLIRAKDGALLQQALIQNSSAIIYSATALRADIMALLPQEKASCEDALTITAKPNRWAVVEGTVKQVTTLKKATYLNFGDDWKSDFTIYIPKATQKAFAPDALLALEGKTVQVRGWLHSYYGPRITLFNPQMMRTIP